MPVPSSGQLRLRADINQEVNGNDSDDNVSLGTLSNDAGFSEPDAMSDFYGYSACQLPGTAINPQSASFDNSGNLTASGFLRNNGGCAITECGLYVGTSSNINSATKHNLYSSWNLYSYRYFNLSGYSNNTTYYIWIYYVNPAGEQRYSFGGVTVPPPLVPVSYGQALVPYGDWSGSLSCPRYNFNGGFSHHFNCGVACTIYTYGGAGFSGNSGTYGVCENTAGVFQPNQWRYQPISFSTPCNITGGSGTQYTGYGAVTASGYANNVRSLTKTCV